MYQVLSYTHKCGRNTCAPPLAPMKDRRVDVAVASITETALIAMLLKGRNVLEEFGGFLPEALEKGGRSHPKHRIQASWGMIQKAN